MTDKDKMREEFEVWCRGRRSLSVFAADRTLAGTYASNEVRFAYEAWKAAKESSRKELEELRTRLSGQTCFVPPEFQQELEAAHTENMEQARLLGMGAERELALMSKLEEGRRELEAAKQRIAELQDIAMNHLMQKEALEKKLADAEEIIRRDEQIILEHERREAAARQQGFEEGFVLSNESLQRSSFAEGKQAGRDELQKELSEQEPVANVVNIGERLSYRISVSINNPNAVYLGMKLIPRPLPPQVKGE